MLLLTWLAAASATISFSTRCQAQDLLNDNPTFSPFNLELRQIVQMPTGQHNIISMTTRLGDPRLYVSTQQGSIFVINQNPNGVVSPTLFFNATNTSAGGVTMTNGNQNFVTQGGLQSVAFHPDFDRIGMPGYGKMFATMVRAHSASASFLGNTSNGSGVPDSVLAEWTYDHNTSTFSNFRELFRVNLPVNDHLIKQARFNPYAEPGDEDYGLLYLTHGDSNLQASIGNYPQLLGNALGKMLRVDPLDPDGAGSLRYTVPATNPFASSVDPTVLKEIYAYGFRNPHTFSFNRDEDGQVHLFAGDIGRSNVEELNLIAPGLNYGWAVREGTFVHRQGTDTVPPGENAGYIYGVAPLPSNEADFAYTYPVAQFDHNANLGQENSSNSIASGFVIRNGSDPNLENQFIFNNFPAKDGVVYHTDLEEMLAAVTDLDAADPNRDEPSELTQAVLHKLNLALDHDNNPATPPQNFNNLNSLLGASRNDARYGEGVFGEMYISTKQAGGRIYLVTNTVPLAGDFNEDRVVDAADYTVWRDSLNTTGYHLAADGNGGGKVDGADFDVWKSHFGETWGAAGGAGSLSVPEPASATLFALGSLFLSVRRIRRKSTH